MSKRELGKIDTRREFGLISRKLLDLLPQLGPDEWQARTCYPNWRVKHIAVHLLQTALSRLSLQRDAYTPEDAPREAVSFDFLSDMIARANDGWAELFESISPQLIVDLLSLADRQLTDYIVNLELKDEALFSVAWAGETISSNWFDIAREYTERWHHQQQIREAVGAEGIATKELCAPVIDTLIRAVPYWYEHIQAPEGTAIVIEISGESGGEWLLAKESNAWHLYRAENETGDAHILLSDDIAWRFLTRTISAEDAGSRIRFSGKSNLCKNFLNVKAIMMKN